MTAPMPPDLRAQVLELRRTQSARAVAQALNIPLGTVKAITSRAGLTRNNQKLREFFRLPEPTASTCTALQPPVAPPEPVAVTDQTTTRCQRNRWHQSATENEAVSSGLVSNAVSMRPPHF